MTAVLDSAGQLGALAALIALTRLEAILAPAQLLFLCGLALVVTCLIAWLRLRRLPDDA